MNNKDFVEIKGFSNYLINKDGEIYSKKSNKTLSKKINNGYEAIQLWEKGKRYDKKVHRLLAENFIPNPNKYNVVNHKDGNKRNNSLDNLEWCTTRENNIHAIKNGLVFHGTNTTAGRTHIPVRIKETGDEFTSISQCARWIIGNPNKIYDCLAGRQKTHRGFHFEKI